MASLPSKAARHASKRAYDRAVAAEVAGVLPHAFSVRDPIRVERQADGTLVSVRRDGCVVARDMHVVSELQRELGRACYRSLVFQLRRTALRTGGVADGGARFERDTLCFVPARCVWPERGTGRGSATKTLLVCRDIVEVYLAANSYERDEDRPWKADVEDFVSAVFPRHVSGVGFGAPQEDDDSDDGACHTPAVKRRRTK
jgi:hypothetical protein